MWKLLPILLVVGLVPLAYAESTATYDLTQNQDGTTTYKAYKIPRLQDESGNWKNYIITEDSSKITVKTNRANGFVYDKVNCAYQVFPIGQITNPLLPGVSWTAKSAINGTNDWQTMAVNNQACAVTVSQSDNQVIITATKTQDKTETYQTINNSTGASTSNTRQVLDQKITHTIQITDKIKETISVYNSADNTKLGAVQTIQNPDITIQGQPVNLAQSAGQFFDRNWILANQAQIFEIANNLNYDFDVGFSSLWGIKVHADKVALDYNNSPGATNYLEIDPTYTDTGPISGSNVTFDLSYPTLNNAIVSSGDIDGTVLSGAQITSVQSAIDGVAATWTTTANTTPINPTYQTDFSSSTGWTTSSSTYNQITGGVLWTDWQRNAGGAQRIYYDLTSVSDTAWVMRFAYNMYSASGGNAHGFIGLASSTQTYSIGNSEDKLVFYPVGNPTESSRTAEILATDNFWGGNGDRVASSLHPVANTWYYFDLVRDGATLKLKRYSDNTYSTVSETTTTSITGTVSNLRYLKGGSYYLGDNAANYVNYFDDLKFYDGVSSTVPTTNVLTLTYTTGVPPDAPTGLSATIQNTNTAPLDIYLQWSAPANVGTGTLTGFEIYRDGNLVTTTGLVSSYTDIVPSAGTYTYHAKAVSTHGTSTSSNSVQVSTPTVPGAPTGLSASAVSVSQINLSWSAPASDGGSALTDYTIQYSADNSNWTTLNDGTSTTTTASITGLNTNTQYYLRVAATNNVGTGSYATTNTSTLNPGAVTTLQITSKGTDFVSIKWSAPTTLYGATVQGYQINYTTPYNPPMTKLVNSTNSTLGSYTVTGLQTGTPYSFRIGLWTYQGGLNANGNIANTTTYQLANYTIGGFALGSDNPNQLGIRLTQEDTANGKALYISYPNTYDLGCDFEYTMARQNQTYSNISGTPQTSERNLATFLFNGTGSEIIHANCYDQNSDDSASMTLTSTDMVFLTQIENFRNGTYGTMGQFGSIDLISILVVFLAMVGFNRVNPAVGVFLAVASMYGLAHFGIINPISAGVGMIVAVLFMLGVITTRRGD